MIVCPLCLNRDSFTVVKGPDSRAYRCCNGCKLIFTETRSRPSAIEEKKRYLTHKNGIQYKGYVEFLNKAIEPASPLLLEGMQGLDFGCGHTPTLSVLLEQQGFLCDNYDPIFFPHLEEGKQYDFVFATECFEHFFFPAKELGLIKKLLKPNGILIVMTDPWVSLEAFEKWYYAKDKTHVSFYHNYTFQFIASKYNLKKIETGNDRVVILQKGEMPISE